MSIYNLSYHFYLVVSRLHIESKNGRLGISTSAEMLDVFKKAKLL